MEAVTLKNGATEGAPLVRVTMLSLEALLREKPIVFFELVQICRDPDYRLFGKAGEDLVDLALLSPTPSGGYVARDSIRNIVLSAASGDGFDLTLVSPVAEPAVAGFFLNGGSGLDAAFQELATTDSYDKEIEVAADHIRRNYSGDPVGAGLAAVLAQDRINYRHKRGAYAEKPTAAVFRKLESDLHEDALDRTAEALLPSGSVDAEVEALLAAEADEEAGNA